jgi:hypothetical protein
MSGMNENTEVIRLDTLAQSDYWVDRYGNQHALTDMTQGYLSNVLGHLRDGAAQLYELEIRRREPHLFLAELTGWDNGRDTSMPARGQEAANGWLESTPIVQTLRTMLGEPGR